jgi:lipopolysaccharide biosynthesis protein
MKLNAVLMLIGFAKLAHYPIVVFIESILLAFVLQPAKVAAKNDNHEIYDFFELEGYSTSIPNLQSLSFHYTRHSMILVLLMGYLHPKRMYKNREFNV